MPTLEEAKHCPKCEMEGKLEKTLPTAKPGYKALIMRCMNDRCAWFNTTWMVTVRPDGSIPEFKPGQDKSYSPMTESQLAMGQRAVEDAVGRDLREE